jgi:tRNA1Val (adenine37-N6)-methyltransferase
VALLQPARGEGYRVNVDALLLAAFASQGRRAARAVDLGAGVGAVALSLLHWDQADRVVLVDIDRLAADTARSNLEANGWAERADVVCADVRDLPRPIGEAADLVVCNPPYVPSGAGRVPLSPRRARARLGEVEHFTAAARRVLGKRARACFLYPAHALGKLWTALSAAGLEPKRLRAVHADAGSPARLVMIEARPAKAGGLVVSPPLFERDARRYTREMIDLLDGRPA